jgi:hypothetical protein
LSIASHIFRQIAHFSGELHRQATADNALLAKLRQRMLVVSQQAVAIVPFAVSKMVNQAADIASIVMFKQRDAKASLERK